MSQILSTKFSTFFKTPLSFSRIFWPMFIPYYLDFERRLPLHPVLTKFGRNWCSRRKSRLCAVKMNHLGYQVYGLWRCSRPILRSYEHIRSQWPTQQRKPICESFVLPISIFDYTSCSTAISSIAVPSPLSVFLHYLDSSYFILIIFTCLEVRFVNYRNVSTSKFTTCFCYYRCSLWGQTSFLRSIFILFY